MRFLGPGDSPGCLPHRFGSISSRSRTGTAPRARTYTRVSRHAHAHVRREAGTATGERNLSTFCRGRMKMKQQESWNHTSDGRARRRLFPVRRKSPRHGTNGESKSIQLAFACLAPCTDPASGADRCPHASRRLGALLVLAGSGCLRGPRSFFTGHRHGVTVTVTGRPHMDMVFDLS